MLNSGRALLALLLSALLISPAAFPFNSPLSEEAIREAYFLGQRRDESMVNFLEKYKQRLGVPESGPQVASVEFLTPFAQLVLRSKDHSMGYSAQQASLDYHGQEDTVAVNIEVLFTASYGAVIQKPTSDRSGSPNGFMLRSSDFWRDVDVQVLVKDKVITSKRFTGEPLYQCGDGCTLVGATLHLEFPAGAFDTDATVEIAPPEGPEVWVDFDLTQLR